MRRNTDIIRHLLLSIEGDDKYKNTEEAKVESEYKEKYKEEWDEIKREHYLWLLEAEFIEAKVINRADGYRFIYPERLKWAGAEYLDSVRDSKVWRTTKEKLSIVGSASLPVIQKIATSIIEKMLII